MFTNTAFAIFLAFTATVLVTPNPTGALNAPKKIGRRCTGEIASLADVAAAEECLTIVINGFTVPAGETFALAPPDGATVFLTGQITFGFLEWAGPLMTVSGKNVTFNGNSNQLFGQGELYWDGQGINGGVTKPDPMLRINMGGSFTNLTLVNSPGRGIAIGGSSLTVSDIDVNNSAGSAPNNKSGSNPAGANTDGFDVSANDVTIESSTVSNQDDCLAINKGNNIVFTGNTCSGGHGISVVTSGPSSNHLLWLITAQGSITSGVTVSNVQITGNTVTSSVNGLRIKTDAIANGSTVTGIVYSDNTLSDITQFGVLIDQSYPATLGTPGTGVILNTVTFTGTNTISVASSAKQVEVNCGSTSSCDGTWDWTGLTVTGGAEGAVKNAPVSGGSF